GARPSHHGRPAVRSRRRCHAEHGRALSLRERRAVGPPQPQLPPSDRRPGTSLPGGRRARAGFLVECHGDVLAVARLAHALALLGAALPLTGVVPARAADAVVLLETEAASAPEPAERAPDPELATIARQVDALVLEAARDLGLGVGAAPARPASEHDDLVALASE